MIMDRFPNRAIRKMRKMRMKKNRPKLDGGNKPIKKKSVVVSLIFSMEY